jgi:hypothetical protein
VVVLGGGAAAVIGSLPKPAQSVAHDALGAVGVSIPAPASTTQARASHLPVVSHPAVAEHQALARLAGGPAQISDYCRTVLNR